MKKLIEKIKNKKSTVGIIGLGYVGLPLAREFLNAGFSVIGFDKDKGKVKKLNQGNTYIKHINSNFIKHYVTEKKKFFATDDFSRLKEVDFILICVPTPLGEHYEPDLSFVKDTTKTIAKNLKKGHVVILESTTYPGTTEEEILPILEKTGMKVGKDFFLGYSPEREDPGNKEFSTSNIPKVISAISKNGLEIIDTFYSQIVKTVPVSSPKVAESSKILENTYRAVNIALVNELKMMFDRMGVDVWEVIEAAKTKPFGFQAFYPGPGLGGHCIPIDPFYLTWKANEYDFSTKFIRLAGEVNISQPYYVVSNIVRALNTMGISVKDAKILIAGVAYNPDIDDMRESPALKIIDLLRKENAASVDYYDPFIPLLPATRKYKFNLRSININKVNNNKYDVIIIVTNHSNINYKNLIEKGKIIIDTRNVLDQEGIKNKKILKS